MYSRLLFIRKVLRIIYQFLFIWMLFDFIKALFQNSLLSLKDIGILAGILIVSYIFRDIFSHGIFLFIIHILSGAGVYFLVDDIFTRVLMILAVLSCFADGLIYMNRGYTLKRVFEAPWEVLLLGIVTTVLSKYIHLPELSLISFISTLLMTGIYLVSLYIEGLTEYIISNRNVTGVPLKQIVSVNSVIVMGVLLAILAGIVIGEVFGLPSLLVKMGHVLLGILKIIVIIVGIIISFIFSLLGGGGFLSFRDGIGEVASTVTETNVFVTIIQFLLYALFFLFILYVIYTATRLFVRLLLKRQHREYDLIEDLKNDRHKSNTIKEKIRHTGESGVLSNEMRARRIYKKKVLSYKHFFRPEKEDTTGDIEKAMLSASNNVETQLTDMYNQVRYGDIRVDREFLKKMNR